MLIWGACTYKDWKYYNKAFPLFQLMNVRLAAALRGIEDEGDGVRADDLDRGERAVVVLPVCDLTRGASTGQRQGVLRTAVHVVCDEQNTERRVFLRLRETGRRIGDHGRLTKTAQRHRNTVHRILHEVGRLGEAVPEVLVLRRESFQLKGVSISLSISRSSRKALV